MDTPEKKLKALYTILDGYETINPRYFTPDLIRLRHCTFYFHSLIDNCLDWLITFKIVPLKDNPNSMEEGEKIALQHVDVLRVLSDLTFSNKVALALEFEIIPKNNDSLLKYINTVRNRFAHPTKIKLDSYKDIKKQIEVLTKLKVVYESIHKLMSKYNFTLSSGKGEG